MSVKGRHAQKNHKGLIIFIVILLIPIVGAIFELIGDIISAILDIFL